MSLTAKGIIGYRIITRKLDFQIHTCYCPASLPLKPKEKLLLALVGKKS